MKFFDNLKWRLFHKPYFIPGKYYTYKGNRDLTRWKKKKEYKCLTYRWNFGLNEYEYRFEGIPGGFYLYPHYLYEGFKEVSRSEKSQYIFDFGE